MPLSKSGYWTAVDETDLELVSGYHWEVITPWPGISYARRRFHDGSGQHAQYMHTLLTDFKLCDHWNGDGLDNRRVNLRNIADGSNGNHANSRKRPGSSRFKGVSYYSPNGRWRAQIQVNGTKRHLGYFVYEVNAAIAYDSAALSEFGEFARTNKMLGLLCD